MPGGPTSQVRRLALAGGRHGNLAARETARPHAHHRGDPARHGRHLSFPLPTSYHMAA